MYRGRSNNMRVYQVFVDRFSTGSKTKDAMLSLKTSRKRMGGNISGLIDKLQYIKSLGFDAVWLTPIFSAADYHGYSTLDFYSIDPHFGSKEVFRKFVEKAHSMKIKVILDFVANHVSYKNRFFRSALNDKNSNYKNWFMFSKNGGYMSFLDVKTLPKLNTKNIDVVNYLIDAGLYWIKEFGIDGYRLDHAIGPTMGFWKAFKRACLSARKDFVFLPEIWLSGIKVKDINTLWFIEDQRDKEKLISILKRNSGVSWDKIMDSMAEEFAMKKFNSIFDTPLNFSSNLWIRRERFDLAEKSNSKGFVFADNHDMQRISWIMKGQISNVLKFIKNSKNSITYYGTEVKLSQNRDFSRLSSFQDVECRRFMDWKTVGKMGISQIF